MQARPALSVQEGAHAPESILDYVPQVHQVPQDKGLYFVAMQFLCVSGRTRTAAPLPLAPVFNPRPVTALVTPSRTTALATTPRPTSRRPLITTTAPARRLQATPKPVPFEPFKPSQQFVGINENASDEKDLLSCDFEESTAASDQTCGVR